MVITDELVDYLAGLSRLDLDESEKLNLKNDLTDILLYVDKLSELDTEGVPELTHPFNDVNRFREDEVINGDERQSLLQRAPDRKGDYFRVKKAIE